MGAYGLYSHIRANRWRSAVLLLGLFLLMFVVAFAVALALEAWSGRATLVVYVLRARADLLRWWPAIVMGVLAWIVVAYNFHQRMIDLLTSGETVTRARNPRLWNLLENLCISRGIPMPKLKIMNTNALNAFASGMNQKQYAISVTRGLLATLSDRELEAVLGHELTHIRNGDVRMMVIATIMAGVATFVGEALYRYLAYGGRIRVSNDRDDQGKANQATAALLIAFALIIVAWASSLLLKFALSRSREYLADAGSVELTKDPDAMISALVKIAGHAELPNAPSAIMEMCIENEKEGWFDLLASHPPVESRIDALVRTAGGHRPPPELSAPEASVASTPAFLPPVAAETPRPGPWGR